MTLKMSFHGDEARTQIIKAKPHLIKKIESSDWIVKIRNNQNSDKKCFFFFSKKNV